MYHMGDIGWFPFLLRCCVSLHNDGNFQNIHIPNIYINIYAIALKEISVVVLDLCLKAT